MYISPIKVKYSHVGMWQTRKMESIFKFVFFLFIYFLFNLSTRQLHTHTHEKKITNKLKCNNLQNEIITGN